MSVNTEKIYPVILSGGSGTRLWPVSRNLYPKQLHALYSQNSMLQDTLMRVHKNNLFHDPTIIANKNHQFIILDQLNGLNISIKNMVLEPVAKNTAPAIITAALILEKINPNAVILIMPSDHIIEENKEFTKAVIKANESAATGKIVTFGITPTSAKTGYGYIKTSDTSGSPYDVESFVEKPNTVNAEKYLSDGSYLWNSGMFLSKASVLIEEAKKLTPQLLELCKKSLGNIENDDRGIIHLNKDIFSLIEGNSFDYAIMEKTERASVVPLNVKWSDLGEWSEIWQTSNKDGANNVSVGNVININTQNSYLQSSGPLLGTVGLDNIIVVATDDAVLVSSKNCTQDVTDLVTKMKKEKKHEHHAHPIVYKPWGSYKIISTQEGFLVKEICVESGKKLSLQKHMHRTEHWVVVSGKATIQKGNEIITLTKDQSTYIPKGEAHRIENCEPEDLIIIEVQSGDYLGEDDIIRMDDDYQRDQHG